MVEGGLKVSILLWNVWNLPSWLTDNKSKTRALLISPLLEGYDIVVLNEAFVNHDSLLHATSHKHRFIVPKPWHTLFSSGLIFLSRYPMIDYSHETFRKRAGVDLFAAKGISGVTFGIVRSGVRYGCLQIFGTHMQASHGHSAQTARRNQVNQVIDYVKHYTDLTATALNPAVFTASILLGDLNCGPRGPSDELYSQHYADSKDAQARTEAYEHLRRALDLEEATSFTNQVRDEEEYSNDICRVLLDRRLAARHEIAYALQQYTDGFNRLSDTRAIVVQVTMFPEEVQASG